MALLCEGPKHGQQTDQRRCELTPTSDTSLRPRAATRSRGRRCFALCQRLHASATTTAESGNRRPTQRPGGNTEHRLRCRPEAPRRRVARDSLRRASVVERLQRAPDDSGCASSACGSDRSGGHVRSGNGAASETSRSIRPSGLTPNVVAEWPPEREARREPTSKRSAAGGRSTPATGWAATPKPRARKPAETLHRTEAVRNDETAETNTAFRRSEEIPAKCMEDRTGVWREHQQRQNA